MKLVFRDPDRVVYFTNREGKTNKERCANARAKKRLAALCCIPTSIHINFVLLFKQPASKGKRPRGSKSQKKVCFLHVDVLW